MSAELIQDLRAAHARLLNLESDLEALKSQIRPARTRIRAARAAVDTILGELLSGQSSLPLWNVDLGNGQTQPPGPREAGSDPRGVTPDLNGQDSEPKTSGTQGVAVDFSKAAPGQPLKAAVTRRDQLRQDADLSAADRQPVRRAHAPAVGIPLESVSIRGRRKKDASA